MRALRHGVGLPRPEVGLHADLLHTVERDHVELVHRLVVLRRVAGAGDDPPLGHRMAPERLELQKLQHGGVERLGHAVDLVEEQDAAPHPALLHVGVHRRDDLAHGVLGGLVLQALEFLVHDERQPERALARVVRHGVGHQADAQLLRDLRHDGRLADAGRTHQEHGALSRGVQKGPPLVVHREVRLDRIFHLLLCFRNVHVALLGSACCRLSPRVARASSVTSIPSRPE